jgi:type II secretory pathway pseudopilin PulG
MVVVAIVAMLAAVGIALMRKHLFASKTTEAVAVIQAIRGAQERWRAENKTYYDVSSGTNAWYPMGTPGRAKYPWDLPAGPDYAKWQRLHPAVTGSVQFGYETRAGAAGDTVPLLVGMKQPAWEVPVEPWYLIQAQADTNGDGVTARFAASSFTGEIYSENEGE